MDGGRGEGGEETVGDEEIVDTPPDVLLSCLEAVGPPRERLFFGMQVTERVGKTILEQLAELLSFFIGEARIAVVGLGVLQVDLFMCHVSWCRADRDSGGSPPPMPCDSQAFSAHPDCWGYRH